MRREIRKEILQGAELLTEHFGSRDWINAIDLSRFNMESHCKCVVGQLFNGDYFTGCIRLGFDAYKYANSDALGFTTSIGGTNFYEMRNAYQDLTAEWAQFIQEAREEE